MGIIIKNSKLVFDELIGTNSFDDIFKNTIRDYYIYGFKSYAQFTKARQIIDKRWKIFSKILGEKWTFEKGKNGRNQIILETVYTGVKNPVDGFYFLHNLSKIGDYLNYLFDLDDRSTLRGGILSIPVSIDELEIVSGKKGREHLLDVNAVEYSIIFNWEQKIKCNAIEREKVRINRQLNIWSCNTRYEQKSFKNKYKNLKSRTEELYNLGVLGDLRDKPEERNKWLQEQWRGYSPEFKKYFNNESGGDHYWYKSKVTMDEICKKLCSNGDNKEEQSFFNSFRTMCEFFSQYYPMGELGTMLSERCNCKVKNYDEDIFHFKHNYLQKTLYDYNLVDILYAIEKGYLCLIEYSHGINMRSCGEIIIPLEIRISVTNGREYVMYYHVNDCKIKAFRMEFIDKITIFSQVDSIYKIKSSVCGSGNKTQKKVISKEKLFVNGEELIRKVALARKMLPYIWGTDVGECEVTENWIDKLIYVKLPIRFNCDDERYIGTRLRKEKRTVSEDEGILIFPTKELRRWIRSFYMRLNVTSDIRIGDFDIASDVEAIWNVYFDKKVLRGEEIVQENEADKKEYVEYDYFVSGETVKESEGHGGLFNELFSRYAIVLAESVLECSGKNSRVDLDEALKRNISRSFKYYSPIESEKVRRELRAYIEDAELVNSKGKTRFILEQGNYLYDVLPITKLELRWLITVLEDPLATIFFSAEQIDKLKKAMQDVPFEVEAFKMSAINYFDRYNLEEQYLQAEEGDTRHSKKEAYFIRKVYKAIICGEKIKIEYKNWRGEKRYVNCKPTWMEYSRRDDIFRIWYINENKNEINMVNVSRILRIIIFNDKKYNKMEQREKLKKIYDQTMTEIQIEFYQGEKNLPDRLLTEFSLWKKKCIYDVTTQKYIMTLYYSTLDEKEILIRLLSYGPYIRVVAPEKNYILSEIKKRIIIQRELIQDNDFEL